MSNRPFIAPRSLGLIIVLLLLVLILGIFKLTPKNQNPKTEIQSLKPIPTSLPSPKSTITPSPSPMVSPTPAQNPQTGWLIYQNTQYGFSFEYPSDWNHTVFYGASEPLILIGNGQGQDVAALSFSLGNLNTPDTVYTASGSAWTYRGWRGKSITTNESGIDLTLVSASISGTLGQSLKIAWVRSLDQGNPYTIDAFLKPILNTFRFTNQ